MAVPYARLVQITNTIVEQKSKEVTEVWNHHAFVGWQFHLCRPPYGLKKYYTFQQWKSSVGLATDFTNTSVYIDKEKGRAKQNLEDVLMAFGEDGHADISKISDIVSSPVGLTAQDMNDYDEDGTSI